MKNLLIKIPFFLLLLSIVIQADNNNKNAYYAAEFIQEQIRSKHIDDEERFVLQQLLDLYVTDDYITAFSLERFWDQYRADWNEEFLREQLVNYGRFALGELPDESNTFENQNYAEKFLLKEYW